MRRFVLVLMIALLPMRGWAADIMAVSMAVQQLDAVQSVQSGMDRGNAADVPVLQTPSSMSADCPMMAMLVGNIGSDTGDQTDSPIFKVCTTCQLCMALAMELSGSFEFAPFVSAAPPVSRTIEFIGVTVSSALKPPIS